MLGGSILRKLLTSPGRLLHPLRRRAAHQTLKGRAPRSILVLCHGNLCRSPFAAALLRQALGAHSVRVESAGFVAPNRPAPPEAVAAAARRGVDLSDHRSRLLTPDLARSAELIVVMDPVQQREVRERFGRLARDLIVLGDLDPAPPEGGPARTIRDPIRQGPAVFEESYARIERCVAGVVSVLGGAAR